MTYTTQPGTIPHRAVEYIRGLPPGTEISTVELAEALGAEGIGPSLMTPKKHGLLSSRPANRMGVHVTLWKLGDGIPIPQLPPPEGEEDDHPIQQRVVPAGKVASAPTVPAAVPTKDQTALAVKEEKSKRRFIMGIFSDGTMQMEVGTQAIVLNATERRQLYAFVGAPQP